MWVGILRIPVSRAEYNVYTGNKKKVTVSEHNQIR